MPLLRNDALWEVIVKTESILSKSWQSWRAELRAVAGDVMSVQYCVDVLYMVIVKRAPALVIIVNTGAAKLRGAQSTGEREGERAGSYLIV